MSSYKKLTDEDLEALEECVAKYEGYAELPADRLGGISLVRTNCALCRMYNIHSYASSGNCVGCPVYFNTGHKFCEGTPFHPETDDEEEDGTPVKCLDDLIEDVDDWIDEEGDRCEALVDELRARLWKEAEYLSSLIENAPTE